VALILYTFIIHIVWWEPFQWWFHSKLHQHTCTLLAPLHVAPFHSTEIRRGSVDSTTWRRSGRARLFTSSLVVRGKNHKQEEVSRLLCDTNIDNQMIINSIDNDRLQ